MKLWLDSCRLSGYMDADCDVKLGIGWFRHHKDHKWKGLTIHLYLYVWLVGIHVVDNYKEYNKKINYKLDPDYLEKMAERLKARKEKK